MRNCWNAGMASMSCKSMLDPCSLLKTSRWVFPVGIYSLNIQKKHPLWTEILTLLFIYLFFCHSQCQVDVYINEEAGINFIEVKGGLSTKALANAITKTHAKKEVQHALVEIMSSLDFLIHRMGLTITLVSDNLKVKVVNPMWDGSRFDISRLFISEMIQMVMADYSAVFIIKLPFFSFFFFNSLLFLFCQCRFHNLIHPVSRHGCISTRQRTNRKHVTAVAIREWMETWLLFMMSTGTPLWETSRYSKCSCWKVFDLAWCPNDR